MPADQIAPSFGLRQIRDHARTNEPHLVIAGDCPALEHARLEPLLAP
jgi:hypothetical protein